MYVPNFRAARLKLSRGRELTEELDNYIKEIFGREAYRPHFGIRSETDLRECVLYCSYMPDLTEVLERASLLVGDAVNNLRAALDYLAYELALKNTDAQPKHPRSVKFPITDTQPTFAKSDGLKEVAEDHRLIIGEYQGYCRIDENTSVGLYFHPLIKLRELSNSDKHRLPITVIVPSTSLQPADVSMVHVLLIGFMQESTERGELRTLPVRLGTEIVRARIDQGPLPPDMEFAGYFGPVLALEDGRSAVAVLRKISGVVDSILARFEALF